jgi:hypothetical protein
MEIQIDAMRKNAAANLAIADRLGERCFKLNYDDMVGAPQLVHPSLLKFLEVDPAISLQSQQVKISKEKIV